MDKKELRRMANELPHQFNVGKAGVTDTLIETIDKYLEAHKIVKIRSLTAEDKAMLREQSDLISQKTHSQIVDSKGFTFVLYRK